MNQPQFPAYQSAEIAARWGCFHCTKPLLPATLADAGYPHGRGRYSMTCPECRMQTFFDLQSNT